MAFTASQVTQSVMGKYRLAVIDVTADGTAGDFASGLRRVTWAFHTVRSGASNILLVSGATGTNGNLMENQGAVGTSIAGQIALTSVVSGGKFRVVAFGPS